MIQRTKFSLGLLTLTALASTILPACASRAGQTAAPAVLVDLTEQNRRQLASVVAKALHRDKVLLAPDALTQTDLLIITRAPRRTLNQNPVMGRSEEKGEYFNLKKENDRCFLIHQSTQEIYPLKDVHCQLKAD